MADDITQRPGESTSDYIARKYGVSGTEKPLDNRETPPAKPQQQQPQQQQQQPPQKRSWGLPDFGPKNRMPQNLAMGGPVVGVGEKFTPDNIYAPNPEAGAPAAATVGIDTSGLDQGGGNSSSAPDGDNFGTPSLDNATMAGRVGNLGMSVLGASPIGTVAMGINSLSNNLSNILGTQPTSPTTLDTAPVSPDMVGQPSQSAREMSTMAQMGRETDEQAAENDRDRNSVAPDRASVAPDLGVQSNDADPGNGRGENSGRGENDGNDTGPGPGTGANGAENGTESTGADSSSGPGEGSGQGGGPGNDAGSTGAGPGSSGEAGGGGDDANGGIITPQTAVPGSVPAGLQTGVPPTGPQQQTLPQLQQQGINMLTPDQMHQKVAQVLSNPQARQQIQMHMEQAIQSGQLTPQALHTAEQLCRAAMQNPALYPQLRQFALSKGLGDARMFPPQYDPKVVMVILAAAQVAEGIINKQQMGEQPGMQPGMNPPMGMPQGSGGMLQGPGNGTSDSIPAVNKANGGQVNVSTGEYVVPADVVRAKGKDFFDTMVRKYHQPTGYRG